MSESAVASSWLPCWPARRSTRHSVASESPAIRDEVRTAEVIGALCLATDLGIGLPFEHGLQSTIVAMRIAEQSWGRRRDRGTGLLRVPALLCRLHRRCGEPAPNSLKTACC